MVLPLIICVTSNVLIFSYVSSSSRRIQTGPASGERQRRTISIRDLHLLRHMIIMLCVSVGGLIPVHLNSIVSMYTPVSQTVVHILSIWYILSLLFNMIDLFLYNHEVRRHLAGLCFRCKHDGNTQS